MSLKVRIKFQPHVFYPLELADQDPNFDWSKFVEKDKILLDNLSYAVPCADETMSDSLDLYNQYLKNDSMFAEFSHMLEPQQGIMVWSGNGYVQDVEVDDMYRDSIELLRSITAGYLEITIV